MADPKLPRRWGTRPGKLISVLGRDPLQRASQQCSARWPEMRGLFPTQWSAIAAGEDAREQTWHTDVDKLPGSLPSMGELPDHLSMMLVLSDKYHLEVHLGSHLGDHDALRVETFQFQRGDMVLFASTLRHRGLAALPGVGKQVVLFGFLTPDERHKWVDVEGFILDPLPGAKDELASRPQGDGPLPNPRAISHWGQYFAFGEGLQGAVGLPRLSSWTTSWPPWARQAPAAHTTRCCWPGLPWTPPTPCATCTWRKATSCGQAGHHGSTWVTVDPGRPPCCSSIGPPAPAPSPHSRLCCSASRGIAGRRSGVQGAMRAPRSRF